MAANFSSDDEKVLQMGKGDGCTIINGNGFNAADSHFGR